MTDRSTLERQLRASLAEVERSKRLERKPVTMQLVKHEPSAALVERVAISGDLSKLSASERVSYYAEVCQSLGLNPLTRPFDYLQLNGKLVLYANKGCTDQLRAVHSVSVQVVDRRFDAEAGVYTVTARASKPDGRVDEDVGSVAIGRLSGEALANATMKAHTKAKRRVTLSICGLSFLDESELESIRDARRVVVDQETGEVLDAPPRISPHGEAEPGEVFGRDEDDLDAIIIAIHQAETMAQLSAALEDHGCHTPEQRDTWHPDMRKKIGYAWNRRKRQLEGDLKSQGRI
jgi:hypothetical protein